MRVLKPLLLALLLCWTATAFPLRVIDGDTFVARLEVTGTAPVWIDTSATLRHDILETIRVLDIDTPERAGLTRAAGDAARTFTLTWLGQGPVSVRACRRDNFGRALATVTRDDTSLAEALIASGHAVRWKTKGK